MKLWVVLSYFCLTGVLAQSSSTASSASSASSSAASSTASSVSSGSSAASTSPATGSSSASTSPATGSSSATTSGTVECPAGWTIGIDSLLCYKFLYDQADGSWFSALQACEQLGGFLVEPKTTKENEMLADVAQLISLLTGVENWYIGASDLVVEGTWQWWHSQTEVTETAWGSGYPNTGDAFNSDDCAMMFVSSTEHYWKDVNCLSTLAAKPICEYTGGLLPSTAASASSGSSASPGSSASTASTASTGASTASSASSVASSASSEASSASSVASSASSEASTSGSSASTASTVASTPACNEGWSAYNGHCYSFFYTTMDWYDGEQYCVDLGGHLVSINSLEEENWVNTLVEAFDGRSLTYWLGGQSSVNSWEWTDGTTYADYVHEFNVTPGRNECLFQRSSSYGSGWSSYACTAGTNIVCQI